MSFIWPVMLVLLWWVPLGILIYVLLQLRRRGLAARFGSFVSGQTTGGRQAGGRQASRRQHVLAGLFLVGLIILTVALARPQAVVSVPRVEGTVILAFDVSGSMGADDVKPTRMDAAKAAAMDFVQHQPATVEVGVVAFSDSGFAVQPPSNDQNAILSAISRLTPQRGTSVGQGILASLDAINSFENPEQTNFYSNATPVPTATPAPVPPGSHGSTVIVLMSDGENNENPDPLAAAQAAADRGVRIFTVGLGSPQGTTLHVNGFTVHTQLDEATLQQIAQITAGSYFNAQNINDLHTVYDRLDEQLIVKPEKMEVTSIFAGASILVLLMGGLLSLWWFGRVP
jgi:Ca-activated chloride channel family protein